VLEEEILPALEKLRKERASYMQWVASSENLDRLRRFCIAHEFAAAKQLHDDSEQQMQSLQASASPYPRTVMC
jgi:structural maintenance of chromosome 2